MKLHARQRRCATTAAALLALGLGSGRPVWAESLDETLYAALLERHTREVSDTAGVRVDYAGLSRSPDWVRLRENVARTHPSQLHGRAEVLAYWINLYNILAIDLVVRNYPVESIRDLGGLFRPVWKLEAVRLEGRSISLHEIEHEILRPLGEPRIHAALVCASVSCPALRREPWTAARLEEQFDDTLRRWLADPAKGLAIDRAAGLLWLSRIFDWFEEDFAPAGGVLAFVTRYAPEAELRWLRGPGAGATRRFLDYDWKLNDLARSVPGG